MDVLDLMNRVMVLAKVCDSEGNYPSCIIVADKELRPGYGSGVRRCSNVLCCLEKGDSEKGFSPRKWQSVFSRLHKFCEEGKLCL